MAVEVTINNCIKQMYIIFQPCMLYQSVMFQFKHFKLSNQAACMYFILM